MNQPETFRALLASLARATGPAVGVRGEYGARWWTYERLYRNALRAAKELRERDLRPGDRVIIWGPNCPEWVAHWLGALGSGLVVVPVDATASTEALIEIVKTTDARFLLFGSQQRHQAVGMPKASLFAPATTGDLPGYELSVNVRPSDPAVILFTSGSTSEPKGVILTHGNLLSQTRPFATWRLFTRWTAVRFLALSPLSHVQGLVLGACLPLNLGWSVLYSQSAGPGHVRQTLRTNRVNALVAVPRVLELLERELVEGGWSGSAWEAHRALGLRFVAFLIGGATLPKERELFWRNLTYAVIQGYGSTETSAFTTLNGPFAGKAGSVGMPVHADSVKIAPDGEILVRGPHVASAYYVSKGKAALTKDGGYISTGDLGFLDSKNRLYFVGRKYNRIVTGEGYNVSPEAVESILCRCEGVRDAVVIPRNRDGLEGLHAVLLMGSGRLAADEIVRRANTELERYERLASWSVWPDGDFPRNPMGKVKRSEIAGLLEKPSHERSVTPEESSDTLEGCLAEPNRNRRIEKLAQYFSVEGCRLSEKDLETKLSEWGLASIDVMLLCAALRAPVHRFLQAPSALNKKELQSRSRSTVAPAWQWYPGARWLRTLVRSTLIRPSLRARLRVRVEGLQRLRNIQAPFVLALDPRSTEHAMDYAAVFLALPRRFSDKLLFVLGARSPGLFDAYFNSGPQDGSLRKSFYRFLFHVGLPSAFPFSLFPHTYSSGTVRGLTRTFAWLDRGYCPLLPWAEGTALLASETQANVIPVRVLEADALSGAGRRFRRIDASVIFGSPFQPGLDMTSNHIYRVVQKKFASEEMDAASERLR